MKNTGRKVGSGFAAGALLTLAACGGGSDSSSSPIDGGLDGEPIKLMAIAATGVSGSTYESMVGASRASVREINANGGVDGRPLELLYCNEKSEAAAAEQCARKAVSEGVLAVVSYVSSRGAAQIYSTLGPASIPVIGGIALTAADYSDPLAFNLDGGAIVSFSLCSTLLAESGATSLGMTRADLDASAALEPVVKGGIEASGATDSGIVVKVPLSATDYSGIIQQLDKEGVEGVTSAVGETAQVQLIQTAETLNSELKICADTSNSSPATLKQLGTASDRFYAVGLPPIDEDSPVPGVSEFVEELKASEKAGDQWAKVADAKPGDLRGWAGPRVVAKVAATVEGELTAATFVEALGKQDALDADMFGTIDFTKPGPVQPSIRNLKGYFVHWSSEKGDFELVDPTLRDAQPVLLGG